MRKYASKELLLQLKQQYSSLSFNEEDEAPLLYVEAEELRGLLQQLKRQGFNRLENITSVDYKEYYEMVYHLFAWQENSWVTVKLKVDHAEPVAPSVTEIFPGADFEEREIYDLMGITLEGHHNLKRILLADNFLGHPLQKSYKQEELPVVRRDLGARRHA